MAEDKLRRIREKLEEARKHVERARIVPGLYYDTLCTQPVIEKSGNTIAIEALADAIEALAEEP